MSWSGPFYREARYTGTWSRAKEKASGEMDTLQRETSSAFGP